jgi:hypothetical protein
MPKFDFYPSFNAGEVSPFTDARTSLEKYRSACRTLENFQILPYGGVIRRPGTEFRGTTKSPAAGEVRLIGFNFSTTTRFLIEMGVGYMRFWSGATGLPVAAAASLATEWATATIYSVGNYVTSSSTRYYCSSAHTSGTFATDLAAGRWVAQTILEVPTQYVGAHLREIQFAQINDILYFAHSSYPPSKLTRIADNNWAFAPVSWDYPPLQDQNATDTTINVTQGSLAIPYWVAGTHYAVGDYVMAPAWVASTPYVLGDIVLSGGIAYTCTTAHTSGATFSAASGWSAIGADGLKLYHYRALTDHIAGSRFAADVAVKKFSTLPLPLTRLGRHIASSNDTIFDPKYVGQQVEMKWPLSSSGFGNVAATTLGARIYIDLTSNNISTAIEVEGEWDVTTSGKWNATVQVLRIDRAKTGVTSATGIRSGNVVTVYHPEHGWTNGDAICVGGNPSISSSPYYTAAANIVYVDADHYTYTTADSTNAGYQKLAPINLTKAEVVAEFTRDTNSAGEANILYSGNQLSQATFLLRAINYVASTSTPSTPRAMLHPRNGVSGGVATLLGVGSSGNGSVPSGTAYFRVDKFLGNNGSNNQYNTKIWALPAFYAGNYPRAVAMHEQRLFWAGTAKDPTTLWGSQIDDFENFQIGAVASDSVKITLAASEGNRIAWLHSQQNSLLIGTSGDEWTLSAADVASSLSATNLEAKRQSSYGSKYMRAVIVNDVLLFVQRNGRKVRELVYELNKDGWVAPDLTLLAEHITRGEITDIAYQQQPDAVLWCVRGDGTLIAMTYERDQKVVGWHRHTLTDADVESVATIYGNGTEDEVWMVVKRTVSGLDYRTIERFPLLWRTYLDDQTAASWRYLDGWSSFPAGIANRSIAGLERFEAKTVTVVQEGQAPITRTVTNGAITVPATGAGYLGIPYTSTLTPMKLDMDFEDGPSQGRKKRIHKIIARLYKSRGGEISTNNGDWYALTDTLSTGDQKMILAGGFALDADVTLRQTAPYPMAVIAILPVWDAFGNE